MNYTNVPTPCYIVQEDALIKNLTTLSGVMERTGAKILLAQKAFSMFAEYPLISKYLAGTTATVRCMYIVRLTRKQIWMSW